MAQTDEGKTFVAAYVEVGSDSALGDDISGVLSGVSVTGGGGNIAEGYTADGDTPIVKAGKKEARRVEVRFWYTENENEGFETINTQYETEDRELFLRYIPLGDEAGNNQFTSARNGDYAAGVIEEFQYPEGEAQGNELIPASVTVVVSELKKEEVSA